MFKQLLISVAVLGLGLVALPADAHFGHSIVIHRTLGGVCTTQTIDHGFLGVFQLGGWSTGSCPVVPTPTPSVSPTVAPVVVQKDKPAGNEGDCESSQSWDACGEGTTNLVYIPELKKWFLKVLTCQDQNKWKGVAYCDLGL